jgi:hypothetical protein
LLLRRHVAEKLCTTEDSVGFCLISAMGTIAAWPECSGLCD